MSNAMTNQSKEIELVIDSLILKQESVDTTIVQLKGKLVRHILAQNSIVIVLHAKDEYGQYIHLQQYEFDYHLDATSVKEIHISALVLSELNPNRKYQFEIKLLTEQAPEHWETIQYYNKMI